MKSMHIRDFLRGGYKDITEPTMITKHGREVATWVPYGTQDWFVTGNQGDQLPMGKKGHAYPTKISSG